jgi:hypothetical protein
MIIEQVKAQNLNSVPVALQSVQSRPERLVGQGCVQMRPERNDQTSRIRVGCLTMPKCLRPGTDIWKTKKYRKFTLWA